MKYYELTDKADDKTFLEGQHLHCKMTLRPEEILAEGEIIVVKLTNGSKYKGKILAFNPIRIGGYQVGEAMIIRVLPV
ncbi:MAG TPA: hypothetical protein VGK59_18820 [Ohtaekwangia sp.]